MIAPGVLILSAFMFWPFLQAFHKSFFNYNGRSVDIFVGIDNYVDLWQNTAFLRSLLTGLTLTIWFVAISIVVPLLVAWLIHHMRSERVRYAFRIAVMVPAVVPTVVGYLLWLRFLSPDGAVNTALRGIGLDVLAVNWLGDPSTALFGLMLVGFPWLNGINTLLFLAAFSHISRDIYESAEIDGARRGRVFFQIELPAVWPQVQVLAVIAVILGLQNYENVFIITGGGPQDSTLVPGLLLFRTAFTYGQFGYANAIGVTIFLIILGLLMLMNAGRVAPIVRRLVKERNDSRA